MKKTLKNEILEFHPDTWLRVRESCGLEAPGRMEEAVDMLRDWAAKQEHFLKKDFHPNYLENLLLASNGSVEKAKQRLDLMCTMRTFVPEFFVNVDANKDFPQLHEKCISLLAPKLSEDHYRLSILKISGYYPKLFQDLLQFFVIITDYMALHDYCKSHICVVDLRDADIYNHVTKLNLVQLRNIFALGTKGHGLRIKSVHFLTPSKAIDVLISLLKQMLSQKIIYRMHVHKTVEELHQHVPKNILPEDLGGEQRSLKKLLDAWLEVLSSEEHVRYMKEMQEARTDESRRREELDDAMFGLPGTFRRLNVD